MGQLCAFSSQEGRKNIEPHVLLVSAPVARHCITRILFKPLDKAELPLLRACRTRRYHPVPFDQSGKHFQGSGAIPLELLLPADEELACPRAALARGTMAIGFSLDGVPVRKSVLTDRRRAHSTSRVASHPQLQSMEEIGAIYGKTSVGDKSAIILIRLKNGVSAESF